MIKRTNIRQFLCIMTLTAILAFIWGNSLLPGKESGNLSGFVATALQALLPFFDFSSEKGMHLLRKAAHFSEFAVLGASFCWFYGMRFVTPPPCILLSLLSGFSAAAIDETIQIFSPDRYASIIDVAIDTAGVFTGILIFHIIFILYIRKKR